MSLKLLKDVSHSGDAKQHILNGVNLFADAVGSTMGPEGQLALIETEGNLPKVTKDGYNVGKSIHLEHPVESLACEMLKEAAQKTVDETADSTTATSVIGQALINLSHAEIQKGTSPLSIKANIEKSRELVVEHLKQNAVPVTDKILYDVALTSANGDKEVAQIVAEAFIKATDEGSVGCFRSETDETFLEYKDATLLEAGYADENYINITSDRTATFANNPLVICSNITFKTFTQIQPFIEFAAANSRELVIISEMEFALQDVLVRNKLKGTLRIAVVTPPGFAQRRKDILSDVALVCGTVPITSTSGDYFVGREAEFLGCAQKVVIGKTDTLISPKTEEVDRTPITDKIAELKGFAQKSSNAYEKDYIQERIARLSSKSSIIKIGGLTPSEVDEKLDRAEDAIGAVKSAKEEGILPGGGIALLTAAKDLYAELDYITMEAIQAPFRKILSNAGIDYQPIETEVGGDIGYDVRQLKSVNMLEAGVVDSCKSIRNAYVNAISVALNINRINFTITNQRMK